MSILNSVLTKKLALKSLISLAFATLLTSCLSEKKQVKETKKYDPKGETDCKDKTFDMNDAPKHADADNVFSTSMKQFANPKLLKKMQEDDTKPGVISLSDYLSSQTPNVLPLAKNLSDCILINRPKVAIMGEVHESAPDLVTLQIAKNIQGEGEKVHFLIEMPFSFEQPLKQYLNKEITEEQYNDKILNVTLKPDDIAKLSSIEKTAHCSKVREIYEAYATQLHKMGIDFTFVDDNIDYEIEETPSSFDASQKMHYTKAIQSKPERDKRIFDRTDKAIQSHPSEILLLKIGHIHANEVVNPNIGDFKEYGLTSQYSTGTLLADKYGKNNIMSTMFGSPTVEASGFKYSDYDRVFNWGDHLPLPSLMALAEYAKQGIPIQATNFTQDLEILENLTK